MLELLDVDFEDYELWGKLYREFVFRNSSLDIFRKCLCGCGERCIDGGYYIEGHSPPIPIGSRNVPHPNGRGEGSGKWMGGISFEPYCSKFNENFKESIRNKYNRLCFLCGKNEHINGEKLSVHHVNYNKKCLCDNIECEFIPLCKSCHSKTNGNREYWEYRFMDMIKPELKIVDRDQLRLRILRGE